LEDHLLVPVIDTLKIKPFVARDYPERWQLAFAAIEKMLIPTAPLFYFISWRARGAGNPTESGAGDFTQCSDQPSDRHE
jgi:hypothetical protein